MFRRRREWTFPLALGHQLGEFTDRQDRIREHAVATGRRRLPAVVGNLPQLGAIGQVAPMQRVYRNTGAPTTTRPWPASLSASGPLANGNPPKYSECVSGNGACSDAGAAAHRRIKLLGQCHRLRRPRSVGHRRAEHRSWMRGCVDGFGESGSLDGSGAIRVATVRSSAGPSAGASQSSNGSDRKTELAGGCTAAA